MLLTVRDTAGGDIRHRAFLACAWPIFGLVGMWRGRLVGMEWDEFWGGCVVLYIGIVLATGFRPVLVMTEALPGRVRSNERLMRRAHMSQVIVIAGIVAGAGYVEFFRG
jgi:hypothetical protein